MQTIMKAFIIILTLLVLAVVLRVIDVLTSRRTIKDTKDLTGGLSRYKDLDD